MLTKAQVYRDGEDCGDVPQGWWLDPSHPSAFSYHDLDSLYPDRYFDVDHVGHERAAEYAKRVHLIFDRIRPVRSLVEFGSAGGHFTEAFYRSTNSVTAIEGTQAGYDRLCKRVPKVDRLCKLDMRNPITLRDMLWEDGNRFDLALCTEVAEHIEIPFAGTLVKSLTDCSDLVWFSAYEPSPKGSHLHHCNERPFEFWVKLFAFFGYGCAMLPEATRKLMEDRGTAVMFNESQFDRAKVEGALTL